MVVALVVPWVLFCGPVPFGRVFLDGDNLIQNFPLRVLVGQDLHHGVLPLFNPYLFSGTPLLGGFNAGAAYPGTWLFAVLPSQTAWSVNLALVYDVALVGTYWFLRRQPVSSTAATFGAVVFAFAGYMSAQIVHIDLIEGASWLPWMLVAVHALTTAPAPDAAPGRVRRRRRWGAGLLAVAGGCSMLAGGPEAFIDGAVLVVVYLVVRVVDRRLLARRNRRWSLPALAALAGGAVGAAGLGAAQFVPGLAFLGQSQRSAGTFAFFSSGSLPARTLPLLAAPFLEGTNQSTASYAGEYNFPEVTSYVGILALIAAFALLARGWRRRPEAREWRVWYVVLGVGFLSALGGSTPFGHLLFAIPIVRDQRLLNRNLLLVDFALAMLAAWLVHLLLEPRPAGPEPAGRTGGRPPDRLGTALTCVPLALSTVACVLLWTVPARVVADLGGQFTVSHDALRDLALVATAELMVAAAATGAVLGADRMSATTLRRVLTVVVVVDLTFFTALVLHPPTTRTVAHARGPLAREFSSLTGDGRFIIYDPDQFQTDDLYQLGQTDLNVIRHQASAQGYAALVDNGYYDATGAHYQEDLDPRTLDGPVWDELNTRVLLSLPSYFVTPDGSGPTATQFPGSTTSPEDAAPGPLALPAGATHRWYLGGVLTATRGTIPASGPGGTDLRVGVVTPAGATTWLAGGSVATDGTGTTSFTLPAPRAIAGVVAENRSGATVRLAAPTLVTEEDGGISLDGRLQGTVTSPHWVYTGTLGAFGVFRNPQARGWAWAESTDGGPAPAGTTIHAPAPGPAGGQRVTVGSVGPVVLVRSVAWSTGWHATAQRLGPDGTPAGPPTDVPVVARGTVQQVTLTGGGTVVVTFRYRSAAAVAGIAVSGASAVALVAWSAAEIVGVRRRRRRGPVKPDRGDRRPRRPAGR